MNEPLRFLLRGEVHEVAQSVDPATTVLDYIRLKLRRTGTKEGCAEGDCGACTVMVAELDGDAVRYQAVNSCIQVIGQLDGKALFTVEDLATAGRLNAVQQAMVECHGAQCGFCTPGIVMSLEAHMLSGRGDDRDALCDTLAGNLCRCTGYRPILDAGRQAAAMAPAPPVPGLVEKLRGLRRSAMLRHVAPAGRFYAPLSLADLDAALAESDPATRWVLGGGTDTGLWITKQGRVPSAFIHLGQVRELRGIAHVNGRLRIGGVVTFSEALPALGRLHPDLAALLRRIGSEQVRNVGTLGGNIANGSPIGDSMPALMALGATIQLYGAGESRVLPLEDFFLGYRKTALLSGEIVAAIEVPPVGAAGRYAIYKISKRFDQDISAVLAAFYLECEGETVRAVRFAFGGMAAIPARARHAEAALRKQGWNPAGIAAAAAALDSDFTPLSDMRASAAYRQQVARNLLHKFFEEVQTGRRMRLEAAE